MAEVRELIKGYREFYEKYFMSGDTLYKALSSDGQSPKTLIIACSDSRVDPSIITNAKPGDIFVIRNVANLVPPYAEKSASLHGVSAALEFGVCVLGVKHIVVLGHSSCAGIGALVDGGKEDSDFIGNWINVARPAKDKAVIESKGRGHEFLLRCCEKQAVQLSLDNLSQFPWIRSRIECGDIKLHGWHFSIESGRLSEYNPLTGSFEEVPV